MVNVTNHSIYNLSENALSSAYYRLTPEQLKEFIAEKEKEVTALKLLLDRRNKDTKRGKAAAHAVNAARDMGTTAALLSLGYMEKGQSKETATERAGHELDLDKIFVRLHLKKYLKEKSKIDRAARNRSIIQLARKGWSNTEIGDKFNLSPSSISQILQKSLRT